MGIRGGVCCRHASINLRDRDVVVSDEAILPESHSQDSVPLDPEGLLHHARTSAGEQATLACCQNGSHEAVLRHHLRGRIRCWI